MQKDEQPASGEKNEKRGMTARLIPVIAVAAVIAAGLTVYANVTSADDHEMTMDETYDMETKTNYELKDTDRHLTDTVEPLTFPSLTTDLPAAESAEKLDMFLKQYSPNGFADYWTLRQFLSGNIKQVSDIVGSRVILTSPGNIGGDDTAVLSDEVTECTILLRSLSYTCAPTAP